MKIIILLLLNLTISLNSFSGEVTGAGKISPEVMNTLMKANITKEFLARHRLKLGEVTGAGKIHIDSLEMIVTKDQVIHLNDVVHTDFKDPSSGMNLSDVSRFNTIDKSFSLGHIKAVITK